MGLGEISIWCGEHPQYGAPTTTWSASELPGGSQEIRTGRPVAGRITQEKNSRTTTRLEDTNTADWELELPPTTTYIGFQAGVASGEGGAWRLSFLPWEGPVLVRMQGVRANICR
ncbi:hypothetical protein PF002_g26012 [Phytophthora fragariae]|uniref:Uncharacterized protein n=2 Tax=Phytophthora fragariae TaxID=53985 RepID=A0A6A3WPG3_9STRA|nr:hypothetical protein PF002_g26012 [Phytophthora fragariae]